MSSRVATSRAPQSHWGSQHRARQPEAVRRHRVSDRRRLRSMAAAVLGAGLAVLIVLGGIFLVSQFVPGVDWPSAICGTTAEFQQ